MVHPPEIVEGNRYKPGCPTPLSQVLCQLHEDNSKEHEYRSWQGTLEAVWKPWDLWHMTLKFGAYILELPVWKKGPDLHRKVERRLRQSQKGTVCWAWA